MTAPTMTKADKIRMRYLTDKFFFDLVNLNAGARTATYADAERVNRLLEQVDRLGFQVVPKE